MMQWHIDKPVLRVRVGTLNNTDRFCKNYLAKNLLKKETKQKLPSGFVTIMFQPRNRKTSNMKVIKDLFFFSAANWQNPMLHTVSNIEVFLIKQWLGKQKLFRTKILMPTFFLVPYTKHLFTGRYQNLKSE